MTAGEDGFSFWSNENVLILFGMALHNSVNLLTTTTLYTG